MGRQRRSLSRSSIDSRERDLYKSESPPPRRGRRSFTPRERSFDTRSRSPPDYRSSERRPERNDRRRGVQQKPPPSRCIGVFGMSIHSSERGVRDIFGKFGPIDHISMITCTHTGRFRGYCFVYYDDINDAKVAKDQCNGMEIDGRRVRVDFSYTTRAHTPTPGQYKGKPHQRRDRDRGERGGRREYYGSGDRGRYRRSRSRSPYGGSRRRYSRSRSR